MGDDLGLDVDLDTSQDFGIEVVGGGIIEITLSDDVSEVRCQSCPPPYQAHLLRDHITPWFRVKSQGTQP